MPRLTRRHRFAPPAASFGPPPPLTPHHHPPSPHILVTNRTPTSTFEASRASTTLRGQGSGGWGRTSISEFRARRPPIRRPRKNRSQAPVVSSRVQIVEIPDS